jgi:FkbM family methyltransferase
VKTDRYNGAMSVVPDPSLLEESADAERREALKNILTPGGIVLDVGANRGQFALDLLAVQKSQIFCFEPLPEAFAHLEGLQKLHPQITPIQMAVSNVSGQTEFHVTEGDAGSSLLAPVENQTSQWLTPSSAGPISIESTRLDEWIVSHDIGNVELLKSDAQGFDGRVIESAGKFLSPDSIGAILVELNFHRFYEGQDSFYGISESLCTKGYFLAGMYRHYNRAGWLWWADGLFLPDREPFSTQF